MRWIKRNASNILGLAGLCLAVLMGGCVTPAHEAPTIMVKSAQFEIFSTMSVEKTKALALELERFHALIYATTNAPKVPPVVPTRIFAFKRNSDYLKYGPRGSAGVFVPGVRENNILLADYSQRLSASEIILHEYVHFVLRNAATTRYPSWYDEGFAEFLSTARTYKDDQVALGAFPKARLSAFQYLEWVPLKRIISANSFLDLRGRARGMFYPESWALVHYLFLDRESTGRPVGEEIEDYLNQVRSGTEPATAFESAFGETTDSASRNIQNILERRKLRVIAIPTESLDYDRTEPSVRSLSPGEVAYWHGKLGFLRGRWEQSEENFRIAVEERPTDSRAWAGLGDALKFQERYDDAGPAFERSIELDADSALNQLDYAEFLEHVARESEFGEERTRLLAEARAAYQRSRELDDSIPETLAMHGRSYTAEGEKAAVGYAMALEALKMMPASQILLGNMAELSLAVGRETEAREWLGKLYALEQGEDAEKEIENHLSAIKARRTKEAAIARGEDPES